MAGGGRKLAKPVLHYSLSWARDETPTRQEMSRAVDGGLEALGLEGHARRRTGAEVLRPIWDRPLHWARFRHEGMLPGGGAAGAGAGWRGAG